MILAEAGYPPVQIERVQALIRRDDLVSDPETAALEDAACLVFIETQLAEMAPRLPRERLVDVIRKTASKMTPAGLAAIAALPIGDAERELLAAALST